MNLLKDIKNVSWKELCSTYYRKWFVVFGLLLSSVGFSFILFTNRDYYGLIGLIGLCIILVSSNNDIWRNGG
jgi:uncharacterized membrane protein YjjP (DUF1212 family)